jgi:hypothetical protein
MTSNYSQRGGQRGVLQVYNSAGVVWCLWGNNDMHWMHEGAILQLTTSFVQEVDVREMTRITTGDDTCWVQGPKRQKAA